MAKDKQKKKQKQQKSHSMPATPVMVINIPHESSMKKNTLIGAVYNNRATEGCD